MQLRRAEEGAAALEEAVREEVTAEMRELIIQIEAEYKVGCRTFWLHGFHAGVCWVQTVCVLPTQCTLVSHQCTSLHLHSRQRHIQPCVFTMY